MSEASELMAKLERRNKINEGEAPEEEIKRTVFNPYTEFKEMTRKQIKDFEKMFKKYDVNSDHFLDLMEMKLLMEKMGAPQTHVGLKEMIAEVDEDLDGKVSFREFLLIYRKAESGELQCEGLKQLAQLTEIDVGEVGVSGAKDFFESKVNKLAEAGKFEAEIRAEQEERKKQAEEAKQRKQNFKEKMAQFQQ